MVWTAKRGLFRPSAALVPASGGTANVLIDRTAGTNIGDLITNGGLAAVFDGVTSQSGAASAGKTGTTDSYAGKTLAAPKVFGQAIVYGSNNNGFYTISEVVVTLTIRGKNGTAPSSATDGTSVGTLSFTDTANESAGRTITSTDLVTTWDHLFVQIHFPGSGDARLAELQLYEWA